jgi:hypothetical protein
MDEGGSHFLSRDITKGGKLQVRHDDRLGRSVRGFSAIFELKSSFVIFVSLRIRHTE